MPDEVPPLPTKIAVKAPDGSVGTIPADKVADFAAAGYTGASAEEYQSALESQRKEAAYGEGLGNTAAAFGEGALRGALPYVGAKLEQAAGVSQEGMREREERHGIASTAGNLAGSVAGIEAGGALLKGAGAAAGIGEGVSAAADAAKAAQVTEDAVGAAKVGSAATSRVGAMLGRAAKGAGIGGALGAGEDLNEDALGETNLTASKLLHDIGTSALWGAGGEGLIGLGEKAVPKVLAKAGDALDALKEKASSAFAKASSAATGAPEDLVRGVMANGPVETGALEKSAVGLKGTARDLASTANETAEKLRAQSMELSSTARPEETASLLHGADVDAVKQSTSELLTNAEAKLSAATGSEDFGYKKPLNDATRIVANLRNDLEGAESAAEVHDAVNSAVKKLDPLAKYGATPSAAERDTIDVVRGLRSDLRDHIANPEVFGQAGERTGAIKGIQTKLINAEKDYYAQLGYKNIDLSTGAKRPVISAAKVEGMLKGMSTDSLAKERVINAFNNYDQVAREYLDQAAKTYKNTSLDAPDIEGLKGLLDKQQTLKGEGVGQLNGPAQQLEKLKGYDKGGLGIEGIGAAGVGAHALGLASGPVAAAGGALAAGVNMLRNPGRTVETLSKLAAVASKVTDSIGAGARSLVRSAPLKTAVLAGSMGASERSSFGEAATASRGTMPIEKRMTEIANLTSNPAGMANLVGKRLTRTTEAAPKLGLAMQVAAVKQANFIKSIMPKNPIAPSLIPSKSLYKPSQPDIRKFERQLNSIEKPVSLLKATKLGMLTPDMVGAVQAVHPELLQEMRTQVLSAMADRRNPQYSPQQRQQLSLFLGQPVDALTSPAFSAFAQAQTASAPAGPPPSKGGGRARTSQAGLGKLDLASNAATPTQRNTGKA